MSQSGILEFIKKKDKESIIRYTRTDGTVTWQKMHRGTEDHDMAHYAVESILRYKKAFFGLLEEGINIGDYEMPNDLKPELLKASNLPYEAVVTEFIVNLLQTDRWNSELGKDIIPMLHDILDNKGINYPEGFTEENLNRIREKYYHLMHQWTLMPADRSLELPVDWLSSD